MPLSNKNPFTHFLNSFKMKKTKLLICLLCTISVVTNVFCQKTAPSVNLLDTTIIGTVTDAKGDVLVGATILIKGTTTGTITDFDGKYALKVFMGAYTLVCAYTGYASQEKNIILGDNQKETVNFTLNEAVLQEVVVTALAQQMQGRVAGITIKGSRSNSTEYYYDGIRIPGNANLQQRLGKANSSIKMNKKQRKAAQHRRDSLEQNGGLNTEEYGTFVENSYKSPKNDALSTFSIDVDKASYANVRRFITNGTKPPTGAVRIEEMVNYFDYNYPQPEGKHPLSIVSEIGACPWNKDHVLLHIGLQGQKMDLANAPKNNLVFLIDVSGSMENATKLPLVKDALRILIQNMREEDRISIVVYAGAAGCVLPSTSGAQKATLLEALNGLNAGGSTAGGEGIQLAYKIAKENFIKDGNNRIILATDGDFNVGVSSESDLVQLIENQRKSGVYLSVLGFGMGNYKDNKMEQLADKGNGNYAYIDKLEEAKKVFGKELGGTLYTIAKDVKLQLEFNPSVVESYRLIGYENRLLNKEDFNDDTKDAGELGAGHTVTALYEIIPKGVEAAENEAPSVDKLRYQKTVSTSKSSLNEMVFVKLRYKKPSENESILMEQTIVNQGLSLSQTSDNFRFSAAVAGFAQILRGSKFVGDFDFAKAKTLANSSFGKDTEGYRAEFVKLIEKAESLDATAKN
jgi:Ca-activated chloride channel homolog